MRLTARTWHLRNLKSVRLKVIVALEQYWDSNEHVLSQTHSGKLVAVNINIKSLPLMLLLATLSEHIQLLRGTNSLKRV